MKIVTEYGIDDDNKKFKVVRHYKVEKRQVAKAVAQRKSWAKFGLSREDKPGPNPATTIVSEEVMMQVCTRLWIYMGYSSNFIVYSQIMVFVRFIYVFSLSQTKKILITKKMTPL